jgi:transcriptional regulator with XRE-family HTH domain
MYKHMKELRKSKKMKQRQLAEYLNCSQKTVSDYENGKTRIPPNVLIELSRLYEANIDYLLDLTEEKALYPQVDP